MAPALQIRLLGTFQLAYDQQPLTTVNSTRLQSLLAYLVLHAGTSHPRQYLAFLLLPDSTEAQARTNLRKLCFQLRQALPAPDQFLQMDNHTLQWKPAAPYTLDVDELRQLLKTLAHEPPLCEKLTQLVDLYVGELLPSCYDDWLLPVRQEFHDNVMSALNRLVALLEQQRAYLDGIRYARRLLQFDPLQERTYQHLIRLYTLNGDRAGALRTYHDCLMMLKRELGVEPDAATTILYEEILTGHFATRRAAEVGSDPALPPMPVVPSHNLVIHRMPLVGRAQELAPSTGVEPLPLVGRHHEWAVLQATWQQVMRGKAQFVTIAGEAGIGKTRLAEELLAWTSQQGVRTARTRAYVAEGALAYAPITEWLRSEALGQGLDQLERLWQTELARLLPELLSQQPNLPQPSPMAEGWQRQRFHEALARAILLGSGPLLLLLDDVQWCDAETLSWLHYLLRFDKQARLLVIGTVRTEAVDEQHPLHELQRQLQRAGQHQALELVPLSGEETTILAGQLTAADITGWTSQLYQETEGNPLFVVEMVRAGRWADTHPAARLEGNRHWARRQDGQATALPPTVQAVIATRLAQLSPLARQLAQVAATIGRAFTLAVLAAASQASEEQLVQALEELWQRRIVRERGHGYDFSHDKIREVVYTALSPIRRRLLHHQVAGVLEQLYAHQINEMAGQLATHYRLAEAPEKALPYLVQAGDHAQHLSAKLEALRYYQEALALARAEDVYYRILAKRAMIYLDLYQGQAAVADFHRLLDQARQAGERKQELKFRLGLLNAYYVVALDDQETDAALKVRTLYSTTQLLARELNDTHNLVRSLLLPIWHFWPALRDQNLRDTREAYALSCALGDEELIMESKLGLLINAPEQEQAEVGDLFIQELQARRDLDRLNQAYCYLMWTHYHLGNFQRMVALCDAGIEVAAKLGMPPVVYPTLKAFALLNLGQVGAAWASLQQEVADEAHVMGSIFKATGIGMVLFEVGAYARAAAILEQVIERADRIHRGWLREWARLHMVRALIRLAQPGQSEWQRAAQALAAVDPDVLHALTPWHTFWLVLQAEMALGEGRHAAALQAIQDANAILTANGYQANLAAAWELQARLLLQLQRPAEALALLAKALPIATEIGYLALTWRLHATQAHTLAALGQTAAAAQAWQTAAQIIQQLAATIPDRQLQQGFLCEPLVESILVCAQIGRQVTG